MKILILSQYFAPENVPIPSELATELAGRGHDVRVLTGFPNYPRGKVFPGFHQRWRQYSVEDGLTVCRVPLFADHSQRAWARMFNYLSFAFSSATARRFAARADVIYVYATQITPALGPWLWRRKSRGVPYVLHIQDLWPDSITGSSISGVQGRFIARALNPWISSVYSRAAKIVAIAPTMRNTLVERGVPTGRVETVFNWAPNTHTDSSGSVRPARLDDRQVTRIVYAGNVGDMQDLNTAVRAAAAAANSGVLLTIIGDGVAKQGLIELVKELGATNIEFRQPVPLETMPVVYGAADFGLVTLKDLALFRGTIPSKFQSILMHGLPVITTVQGDVRELTEQYELGFTADAGSATSLEAAFRLASECSPSERHALRERATDIAGRLFSRTAAVTQLESALIEAAGERNIRND
ncbi:glycosyltransferase family 4 protein [Paenarthrobacter ureafaciens]|uniref:glycosyltransferase family 4 protein n=1 Tax=Paenarthrobacter ureafaciens TaxID=37931 RepID=UPI0022720FF0|nr:glycosyltransferase family 4 protein [Paenarthrobacter ureafaciens]MCY0975614.1 glycosyltransferase family 4 protein [Paenarthrobacter ureafaciens]